MISTNWSIVGHGGLSNSLQSSLDTGPPAPCIADSGRFSVGKRTLALALASAINCGQPDQPCWTLPVVQHDRAWHASRCGLVEAESGERSREGAPSSRYATLQRFASRLRPAGIALLVIIPARSSSGLRCQPPMRCSKRSRSRRLQVRLVLTSAPDSLLPTIVSALPDDSTSSLANGADQRRLVERWLVVPAAGRSAGPPQPGRIGWQSSA